MEECVFKNNCSNIALTLKRRSLPKPGVIYPDVLHVFYFEQYLFNASLDDSKETFLGPIYIIRSYFIMVYSEFHNFYMHLLL